MNGLMLLRVFIAGTLVFLSLNLQGCCGGGGGSKVKTESKSINTTLGTELKDLKDAYDQGIITEKQYKEAKEKLLKERGKSE